MLCPICPQVRVRWYGPNAPKLCFVERKTHAESWKGEKSVKERFTLPEEKVRSPQWECSSTIMSATPFGF
jgi:SPX domain protein involved in polyphosphate accumulation